MNHQSRSETLRIKLTIRFREAENLKLKIFETNNKRQRKKKLPPEIFTEGKNFLHVFS